jgi:hypothetical protein
LRADGRLEHLGRLDRQVKIRGFRIELDEIRSVLLECEGLFVASVLVNGAADATRVDAYVVLSRGNTSPEHMVLSTVTVVADFRLMPNGKLDTACPPAPVRSNFATFEVAPAQCQGQRGGAWHDRRTRHGCQRRGDAATDLVQDLGHRGRHRRIDDNVFELGANSLYAVRIDVATRESG